ncbi:MAG: Fur family transcriptional regulator [Chloroflexota bacterium]|nr:Fur family transcriptional regulator [Chloroflexota bacterium]
MSCFETLKAKGYRMTAERRAILEILHSTDGHITADRIYHQVRAKFPKANKSTVYRTLELLKGLNLVAETNLGGNSVCYHHIEQSHHHHLVCQKCGRVYDVDAAVFAPLQELLIKKYQFVPDIRHLAIFGYCPKCQG